MFDFKAATIVTTVKYLLGVFAPDTDRDNGPVIKGLLALAGLNEGWATEPAILDLAGKVCAWKEGKTTYHHPLTPDQFALAKKLVSNHATTLARLAKTNAEKAAITPPVASECPAAVGSPRPRKAATRKAKPVAVAVNPDAPAPWEIDDAA
jgi:hypothetical protein